jgi:hypothetical protein
MPLFMRWLLDQRRGNSQEDILRMLEQQTQALVDAVSAGNASVWDTRRIVHVAATAHPPAAWTAQQLREAFPWDRAPRYLLRDRDHAFDGLGVTARAMGMQEVLTAPGAPTSSTTPHRAA